MTRLYKIEIEIKLNLKLNIRSKKSLLYSLYYCFICEYIFITNVNNLLFLFIFIFNFAYVFILSNRSESIPICLILGKQFSLHGHFRGRNIFSLNIVDMGIKRFSLIN